MNILAFFPISIEYIFPILWIFCCQLLYLCSSVVYVYRIGIYFFLKKLLQNKSTMGAIEG